MPESVHAPHPVKQPNLTRQFPLTGMPTGLMAALVTGHDLRADHEALFMQIAAIGATLTLLGSTAAVPELWAPEAWLIQTRLCWPTSNWRMTLPGESGLGS